MANLSDYMAWRGDLSLENAPFDCVDALALCQITYLNYSGIIPCEDFKKPVTILEMAKRFRALPDFETRGNAGALINKDTLVLLFEMASSERFKNVLVSGYVYITDLKKEEQFCAATYTFDRKNHFIAFQGTDDSVVGWKEDFHLATMDSVPAQTDAKAYVEKAAAALKGNIYIGGHSKGGNLSVYSAAHSSLKIKKRLVKIYNFDGPGFSEEKFRTEEFKDIVPKIRSYYPQFSIIGMLFAHAGEYRVVESDEKGLMQHDPYSWHIKGKKFVTLDKFDEAAVRIQETLNQWMKELNQKQLEILVESLFGIFQTMNIRTNTEFGSNIIKNSVKSIQIYMKQDPQTRKILDLIFKQLVKLGFKNSLDLAGIIKYSQEARRERKEMKKDKKTEIPTLEQMQSQ